MLHLWVEVLQQVHLHAVPQPVLQAEVLPLVLRLALLLDLLVEAHPQVPRAEEVQVPVGAVQVEVVLLVPKKLHQQSQSSNQVQN